MSRQVTKKKGRPTIVDNYPRLLTDIKQRIRTAQVRTTMAGNASLLMLYWEIGGVLAARQNTEGWGAAVLPRLAIDLHNDLPEVHGFSERNMRRMIQFHQEYPGLFSIWPRPVAKSQGPSETASIRPRPVAQLAARTSRGRKGPPAVAQLPTDPAESTLLRAITQIPWAHNVILIQMVKDHTITPRRGGGISTMRTFLRGQIRADRLTTRSYGATFSGTTLLVVLALPRTSP